MRVSGASTDGVVTTAALTVTRLGEGVAVITITATNPNSPEGVAQFTYTNDVSAPVAALSYTVSGNVVSTVKGDDVVTITATFDESIADTSAMRISGIGVEEVTGEEMTRVNESTYTDEWTSVNPGWGGLRFLGDVLGCGSCGERGGFKPGLLRNVGEHQSGPIAGG